MESAGQHPAQAACINRVRTRRLGVVTLVAPGEAVAGLENGVLRKRASAVSDHEKNDFSAGDSDHVLG